MAGMWLVVKPAVMRAMSPTLRHGTPAVWRAPAVQHHLLVVRHGHAGHRAYRLHVTETVGGEDLRQEVDVAAVLDRDYNAMLDLLLRLGHRPLVQVRPLAGLE